eukprot:4999498-Pleurochrysis_carterae.AAC.10
MRGGVTRGIVPIPTTIAIAAGEATRIATARSCGRGDRSGCAAPGQCAPLRRLVSRPIVQSLYGCRHFTVIDEIHDLFISQQCEWKEWRSEKGGAL